MGVQAVWDDDPQTILRFIFEDDWDWDELAGIENHIFNGAQRVSYIADFQYSALDAPGLTAPHLKRVPILLHPDSEILVILGGKHFTRSLFDIIRLVFGDVRESIAIARTLGEARARIEEYRTAQARV